MASRRGAVKINPVTGKLEKIDPASLVNPDGSKKVRDGALLVDQRYINAAKELGLGTDEGMYAHIKGLKRMGGADIPIGQSMEREGGSGGREHSSVDARNFDAVASVMAKEKALTKKGVSRIHGMGSTPAASSSAPSRTGEKKELALPTAAKSVGNARVHGFQSSSADSKIAMPTASKGFSAARVHGFSSRPSKPSVHNHEDAFQKRKGVVNTFGGAKDVTRQQKEEPKPLPPKGSGAQIMGMDMLDAHTAEGKAKRLAIERREKNGGFKYDGVHVAGGGGRIATINGDIKKASAERGAHVNAALAAAKNSNLNSTGRPKAADVFRQKMASTTTTKVLKPKYEAGGGVSLNEVGVENTNFSAPATSQKSASVVRSTEMNSHTADDVRAARAAHFAKLEAEQKAKKAAAAAMLNARD